MQPADFWVGLGYSPSHSTFPVFHSKRRPGGSVVGKSGVLFPDLAEPSNLKSNALFENIPDMGEKLNIGAGKSQIPGFRNIDVAPHAEITLDLNTDPLPFDDNSVDLIFSYHTLEHVGNYLFALAEIHRVLRHGGVFYLGVPYVTLTEYNLVNPYHKTNFNEHSFAFFDPDRMLGTAAEPGATKFREVGHRLDYMSPFKRWPERLKTVARRRLFNVVRKIDFCLLALKDDSPLVANQSEEKHWQEFDKLLAARVPYTAT